MGVWTVLILLIGSVVLALEDYEIERDTHDCIRLTWLITRDKGFDPIKTNIWEDVEKT